MVTNHEKDICNPFRVWGLRGPVRDGLRGPHRTETYHAVPKLRRTLAHVRKYNVQTSCRGSRSRLRRTGPSASGLGERAAYCCFGVPNFQRWALASRQGRFHDGRTGVDLTTPGWNGWMDGR